MKIIPVLLLSMFVLVACERSSRTQAAYGDPEAERDRYEDRVVAHLKEFEHRFDGLEERLKGLDSAAQEHLNLDIAELRDRKDALERKFNDLRDVSGESWDDLRASLDRDIAQLEVACDIVSDNNHGPGHAPLELRDSPRR
jgi:uncharacterized lipoprotein YehR (DUF1307 family)